MPGGAVVNDERDTIAAVATPPGRGGIGVVRVSGPRAVEIVARVVGRLPATLPDRQLVRAAAVDPDSGERLDEVLCVAMRAPRSFTGEDVAEIQGHGGPVNMGRLLRAVLAAGARPAEPGEFTRRAVESGRLDLVRAEAVLGVIEAGSERALRLAQAQLAGELGARVEALRARTVELLAELEAGIDFPEEGIEVAGTAALARRAAEIAADCERLAASFGAGRALREGIDVALVGPVNAGKSSLFNRLVGGERALVAEEPGTTRDFVEAHLVWDGVPVTLVDTAGWREADADLERRGIELGRRRAAKSDIEILLVPGDRHPLQIGNDLGDLTRLPRGRQKEQRSSQPVGAAGTPEREPAGASDLGPLPEETPVEPRRLLVVSKGDAMTAPAPAGVLVTSALTGSGLDELRRQVLERVGARAAEEGAVVTSERQRDLVARAGAALRRAAEAAAARHAEEVLALEVRDASQALARVLGVEVGDEMLDELFARFCIGK